MIFVNLDNGLTYNGEKPYVHWFDDEQSTNLNYVKKLCFITDKASVSININKNDIFSLIDISGLTSSVSESINDIDYKVIESFKVSSLSSTSIAVGAKYIHVVYILGNSKNEGEFLESIYIDGNEYNIGASFYDKYEPHKINLSNMGVAIPESFFRAIYPTNLHEDEIDNITVNRKYKELLNEYWNIIANKGSYKSLYNSLKWFEYGDLIKIQELWKNPDTYNQQDIIDYIDYKVKDYLIQQKKTTYFGLYLPWQKISDTLDDYANNVDVVNGKNYSVLREENPKLEEIASLWSRKELCLKMFLVGNFFETYFTPIHLDVIHSTVENIVFANTIKLKQEGKVSVYNYVNNIYTFKCNVKDNSTFLLGDVHAQVGPDTILGTQWINVKNEEYSDTIILGVDNIVEDLYNDDNNLKTFASQYYNGIGKIVEFECDVDLADGDSIKSISAQLQKDSDDVICCNQKLIVSKDDAHNIKFNILCKESGSYKITISFSSLNGNEYVKVVNFIILDNTSVSLDLYKVMYNTLPEHSDQNLYPSASNYMFSHYNFSELEKYKIFLPTDGDVKFHRTIIVKGDIDPNKALINDIKSSTIKYNRYYNFEPYYKPIIKYYIEDSGELSVEHPGAERDYLEYIGDTEVYEGKLFHKLSLFEYDSTGYIKNNDVYFLVENIEDFNIRSKPDYVITTDMYQEYMDPEYIIIQGVDVIEPIQESRNTYKPYIEYWVNLLDSLRFTGEKFKYNGTDYYKLDIYYKGEKTDEFALVSDIENFNMGSSPEHILKYPSLLNNTGKTITIKSVVETNPLTATYTIFILPLDTPSNFSLIGVPIEDYIRDDYVFYPEFHHLEKVKTNTIEDYTFSQKDILIVIPNSNYFKYIDEPEWTFENASTIHKKSPLKFKSIKTPFIANNKYELLDKGFYNIKLKYLLDDTLQESSLNSAFIIK